MIYIPLGGAGLQEADKAWRALVSVATRSQAKRASAQTLRILLFQWQSVHQANTEALRHYKYDGFSCSQFSSKTQKRPDTTNTTVSITTAKHRSAQTLQI